MIRLRYVWWAVAASLAMFACNSAVGQTAAFDTHVVGAHGHGVNSLYGAINLLDGHLPDRFDVTDQYQMLNFNLADHYDGGMFKNDANFPGVTPRHENDFTLDATSWVVIPFAGIYTFGVSSDDGWRLKVGDYSHQRVGLQAPKNTYMHVTFAQPGPYPIDMTYFQHRQRAELELYATFGSYTHFGQVGSNFQLVGDVAHGGLGLTIPVNAPPNVTSAAPEPASGVIALVAGVSLLLGRRR